MAVTTTPQSREIAFEAWVQRIPARALKCRIQGHRLPDWDDRRNVTLVKNKVTGYAYIEAECLRHCGTTVTTFLDAAGFLTRARKVHYYDPNYNYLMPKEARGGGLGKAWKARMREEFMTRNAEWITQEDDPAE